MNTEDGNKIIAEFMELKKLSETEWINPVLASRTDHLAYHESWGWLMPVVEKISKMPLIGAKDISDTCYPRTFGMVNTETGNVMVRLNGSFLNEAPTLIEATWLAVVEFITMVQ